MVLLALTDACASPEGDRPQDFILAGPIALNETTRVLPTPTGLELHRGNQHEPILAGTLIEAPLISQRGGSSWFSAAQGDGNRFVLLQVAPDNGQVGDGVGRHTVIKSRTPISRLAWDEREERIAFVWAGPEGGVAGIYLLDLREPRPKPQRLTNIGLPPGSPGADPPGFLPLPQPDPPTFSLNRLIWHSEHGRHSLELP
jgi:hypothetical protein